MFKLTASILAVCTLGLSYKGIGLGFVISYEDEVRLTNAGRLFVDWDN